MATFPVTPAPSDLKAKLTRDARQGSPSTTRKQRRGWRQVQRIVGLHARLLMLQ